MHARIQCLSLILTGMSILEHVNMSTYLVSLAPRISPSSTKFQKTGVSKKVLRWPSILLEGLWLWFVIEKFERPPVFLHQYPSHHVMITSCSQWGDCNAKIDSMPGGVWSPTMMLVAKALVIVWSYCFGSHANGSAVGLSCCHIFATVIGSSPCWRFVSGPVCCMVFDLVSTCCRLFFCSLMCVCLPGWKK